MHNLTRIYRADDMWNATSGRFILDNGLTSVFDALMSVVDLYEQKSEYIIETLRNITAGTLLHRLVCFHSILM